MRRSASEVFCNCVGFVNQSSVLKFEHWELSVCSLCLEFSTILLLLGYYNCFDFGLSDLSDDLSKVIMEVIESVSVKFHSVCFLRLNKLLIV